MARVSKQKMSESVFKSQTKIKDNKNKVITLIYDKTGNECDYLPADQIMAQHVIATKESKFYVRINSENKLYRINDKEYVEKSYSLVRSNGRDPFKMKNCSKEMFLIYLQYLSSGKIEYLNKAERMI